MKNRWLQLGSLVLSLVLIFPRLTLAQQGVGVVTALKGKAKLGRAGAKTALRYKDNLALKDIINTEEKSLARLLFGGKSTVTVRELSSLEIREESLPGGGTRYIHNLSSGAVLVNVAKLLLARGDKVEIRTPNAVGAVRGSAVFVHFIPALAQSIFSVLSGIVDVTPKGGTTVTLTKNTTLGVTGMPASGGQGGTGAPASGGQGGTVTSAGVQVGTVGTITQAQANGIAQASTVTVGAPPAAVPNQGQIVNVQMQQATQLATTLASQAAQGGPVATGPGPTGGSGGGTPTAPTPPTPVTPDIIEEVKKQLTPPLLVPPSVDFSTGSTQNFSTITISFGVLSGSDDITASDLFTWSSGTMRGTGTTFANGGILFDTGNNKNLRRTLTNAAGQTASWTDGNIFFSGGGATFNNPGIFRAEHAGNQVFGDLGGVGDRVFNNTGTFIKDNGPGGASRTQYVATFNNTGSVDVQAGELLFSGPVTGAGSFNVAAGGSLIKTSAGPMVSPSGGVFAIANGAGASIFDLTGSGTDAVTGLGNTKSLETTGELLEGTNAATITTNRVVKLDTALLEASAPIISLIGTNPNTTLTTNGSTMEFIKSKVTRVGSVVALDKGLINVTNGPLINLTSGSNMDITGDLLSLTNGSKINVVNGPLIRVDGVAPSGTNPAVSTLNVSGALVNFGGTGGNQIVVNNAIAPTATLSGIPVSTATGGAINIGPNPVTNPGLGSITVNGGGSLIQATNNGQVNITAP